MFWSLFKTYLKLYFNFTRTERLALVFIFFFYGLALYFPEIVLKSHQTNEVSSISTVVDTFYLSLTERPKEDYLSRLDKYIIKRYDTIKLFTFDPNTATAEELKKLGLTGKQVKTILTYRSRGGKFLVKDDFRKIYGIRYRQYKILEPYIALPEELKETKSTAYTAGTKRDTLFHFDPNIISKDSLVLLGFSPKQAQAIIKAREKGWRFETKYDFARLYVVDKKMFSRLKNYITLPDKHKIEQIELNTADTTELKKLPGIGSYYAKKIVKYRDALGGYYTTQQLKEIYGFRQSLFAKIKPFVYVDTAQITRLNINKAGYKTLVAHPYINSEMAGWITRRRKRKPFTSVGELNQKGLVTPAQFEKLKHYLTVE